jgi:hypothetical protein
MITDPAQINPAGKTNRRLRVMQLLFAVAAAIAIFAMFGNLDAARSDAPGAALNPALVRLTDMAVTVPGGFAADENDDWIQQQEQQNLQQMQQSMQQAEEQNEQAEQQFEQGMQQAQQAEQQANQ